MAMIQNCFKIAVRELLKQKMHHNQLLIHQSSDDEPGE